MSKNNWNVPDSTGKKRVTLHDVAHHAGVSKSTVSLVLQDSTQVKQQTREKILRSIEETGYVYNRKAAGLRQAQRNDLIGIVINSFVSPYSAEILNQFEKLALQNSLVPMIASNRATRATGANNPPVYGTQGGRFYYLSGTQYLCFLALQTVEKWLSACTDYARSAI